VNYRKNIVFNNYKNYITKTYLPTFYSTIKHIIVFCFFINNSYLNLNAYTMYLSVNINESIIQFNSCTSYNHTNTGAFKNLTLVFKH